MIKARSVTLDEFNDHVHDWPRQLTRTEHAGMVNYFDHYKRHGLDALVANYRAKDAQGPERDWRIWREEA